MPMAVDWSDILFIVFQMLLYMTFWMLKTMAMVTKAFLKSGTFWNF